MSKISAAVVGEAGDNILYIVIMKGDEPVKDGLFRLQHPGMMTVESWNGDVVKQTEDGLKMQTAQRTKRFFTECVFPVSEPIAGTLEESLVEKYGRNAGGKIRPEKLHPRFHSVWNRVSTRFLDGELWNDLPESGQTSNESRNGEGGG